MSDTTNSAPAGWYADPSNPAVEHWWDGSAYNGSRAAAVAPPPPPAPPSAPAAQAPYPAQTAYPAQTGQPVNVYVNVPSAAVLPPGVSPKSRTVASILGFFLGGLGVDRFYLGNTGMGVAKLLLGWLTIGIWPLIDWIIIITGSAHDGQGLRVTNWN